MRRSAVDEEMDRIYRVYYPESEPVRTNMDEERERDARWMRTLNEEYSIHGRGGASQGRIRSHLNLPYEDDY